MKKILIIITSILAIILLITVALWQKNTYDAKKAGKAPMSFREFIGFGSKTQNGTGTGGDLSSGFTDQANNTANSVQDDTFNNSNALFNNFNDSIFNNAAIAPVVGGSGTGAGTTNTIVSNGTNGTNTTQGSTTSASPTTTAITASCSTEDQTLDFTDSELAALQSLKDELTALNGTLYNDDDVAAATENYNSLSLLLDKFTEQKNYCKQQMPQLTGDYAKRLATPYWNEPATNTTNFLLTVGKPFLPSSFFAARGDGGTNGAPAPVYGLDPEAPATGYYDEIEKIFRLHIW